MDPHEAAKDLVLADKVTLVACGTCGTVHLQLHDGGAITAAASLSPDGAEALGLALVRLADRLRGGGPAEPVVALSLATPRLN
jgi:uncharacterized lipoprotein YmbA